MNNKFKSYSITQTDKLLTVLLCFERNGVHWEKEETEHNNSCGLFGVAVLRTFKTLYHPVSVSEIHYTFHRWMTWPARVIICWVGRTLMHHGREACLQ